MDYHEIKFPEKTLFLVTGGAGFIGSNLCETLLELGYRVRCVDDLSTGKMSNTFIENKNYEFVRGDIKNFDTCLRVCDGVDYVLHQAAWGSVPRSIERPLFYCENNIVGTVNMLEASRQNNVKKFVYATSSSVYGDSEILPKSEGTEGEPLSPYALTKKASEEWARQYTKHYGLKTYGLRYFNVFGKRQNPNGTYAAVIPKFICRILNGESPEIYGDGTQSRDFTYIENVIEANVKACSASDEFAGEVFNIACGEQISLLSLCKILTEIIGVNVQPKFSPIRKADVKHSRADISKAKKMLGYDPQWNFERGINSAIEWYKTIYENSYGNNDNL